MDGLFLLSDLVGIVYEDPRTGRDWFLQLQPNCRPLPSGISWLSYLLNDVPYGAPNFLT